ncbi:J domain-containing protein [Limnohabitans sp.]|uniref:J domain-containing protein n=1 Tax=Limnohabitans sp. TaxID=1907725 RepID=UPI00286F5E63|nr:J domain-containing protein [Limnohabitans sp.]
MDGFKDLYAVLGVAPTAAPEVIRAAYRALALRHHPDRHAHSAIDGSVMAELNKAYDVLSCPESRRVYDQGHQRAQLASASERGHAYLNQALNRDPTTPMVLTTYDRRGRLHAYA